MKVKITSIAAAKSLVDALESSGNGFSVYFENQSVGQHDVYYHREDGWHTYYAEQNSRSTDVKNLTSDEAAKILYLNRKQFNGMSFDSDEGFYYDVE